MMQHPIGVGAVIHGETADIQVLLVADLDFFVGEHHLGIHLRRVCSRLSLVAQCHRVVEGLLASYLGDDER